MFKRLLFILLAAVILLIPIQTISAAKKRIRVVAPRGTSYSSARLSRATNSIVVTFLNLSKVTKISYELNYTANGIEQGALGSLTPSGQGTDSRDIYFGTCSKGVCTPHYNIKNATLTVTTTFASGGTNIKLYRIKI